MQDVPIPVTEKTSVPLTGIAGPLRAWMGPACRPVPADADRERGEGCPGASPKWTETTATESWVEAGMQSGMRQESALDGAGAGPTRRGGPGHRLGGQDRPRAARLTL